MPEGVCFGGGIMHGDLGMADMQWAHSETNQQKLKLMGVRYPSHCLGAAHMLIRGEGHPCDARPLWEGICVAEDQVFGGGV